MRVLEENQQPDISFFWHKTCLNNHNNILRPLCTLWPMQKGYIVRSLNTALEPYYSLPDAFPEDNGIKGKVSAFRHRLKQLVHWQRKQRGEFRA